MEANCLSPSSGDEGWQEEARGRIVTAASQSHSFPFPPQWSQGKGRTGTAPLSQGCAAGRWSTPLPFLWRMSWLLQKESFLACTLAFVIPDPVSTHDCNYEIRNINLDSYNFFKNEESITTTNICFLCGWYGWFQINQFQVVGTSPSLFKNLMSYSRTHCKYLVKLRSKSHLSSTSTQTLNLCFILPGNSSIL